MRKILIAIAASFLLTLIFTMNFAPDTLSLLFIGLMSVLLVWGFWFGLLPVALFLGGFQTARQNLLELETVQTSSSWVAVQQVQHMFHQKTLDELFEKYKVKVHTQENDGFLISDIEEFINEDILALHSWQGVVTHIPGSFTALGLLGTFVGLIIGVSGIGFSSVEAAVGSIELLLSGINTAFYTSIVGVIFSVLFNLLYRLEWNYMLRELGLFCDDFHTTVFPTMEEQERIKKVNDMNLILERLDRLPKDATYAVAAENMKSALNSENEKRLLPEVRKGLRDGEFSFNLRPKYDLNSGNIIGGEAAIFWMHGTLGNISANTFLPVLEQNGYIATVDKYLWEEVCKTLRKWLDAGLRPLPIAVNITKTDILAMDIAAVFTDLIHKYRIPPQLLELEIAENAFLQCESIVYEFAELLRQNGFQIIMDLFNGDFVELSTLDITEIDAIKLDLRFIRQNGSRATQTITTIFEKAHKMHCPMLVTGIETAEQIAVLRKAGCNVGQGDYLKEHMSIEKFEELME